MMRRRHAGSECRSRGFSLIELLISMVVVAIVMSIAFDILLEARSSFSRLDIDPIEELVIAQVRADVRSATSPPEALGFWVSEDLLLANHPAGTVAIFRRDGRLFRGVVSPSTGLDEAGARALLDSVVQWRWRKLSKRVVEIEIGVLVSRPTGLRRGASRAVVPRWETETHRFVVASRGGMRTWL